MHYIKYCISKISELVEDPHLTEANFGAQAVLSHGPEQLKRTLISIRDYFSMMEPS
jgi:hypothetical protein